MKFTLSTITILSASLLAAAAPAAEPLNPLTVDKRQCVVNSANTDVWHEAGLSRYRTAYSCDPGNLCDQYCGDFKGFASQYGGSNIQCWNDGTLGWTLDSSWALGAAGDNAYFRTLGESREQWRGRNGCTTG